MQQIIALLPRLPEVKGLGWQRIQSTDKYQFRWKAHPFANLIIESPMSQPFGKIWEIRLRREEGKNRARTASYPLNFKLQLKNQAKIPSHQIEWIFDSGKFLFFSDCQIGATFSEDPFGWLLSAVRSLPSSEAPQTPQSQPLKPQLAQTPQSQKPTPQPKQPPPAHRKTQSLNASDASAAVNEGLDNQRRADQSAEDVKEAVASLQAAGNWPSATTKRIKLLRSKIEQMRGGASIAKATLYKEHIKTLWHPDF